jgi:hypothetical protein
MDWKLFERNRLWFNRDTISDFCWGGGGIEEFHEKPVRIAGDPAGIRIECVRNSLTHSTAL